MMERLSNLKLNLMLQNADAYYLIGATRGQQSHYDGPHMGKEHVLRVNVNHLNWGPHNSFFARHMSADLSLLF
jgi:hypothetical protein